MLYNDHICTCHFFSWEDEDNPVELLVFPMFRPTCLVDLEFPSRIPELTGSSISALMLSSNRNQKWVVQKIAPIWKNPRLDGLWWFGAFFSGTTMKYWGTTTNYVIVFGSIELNSWVSWVVTSSDWLVTAEAGIPVQPVPRDDLGLLNTAPMKWVFRFRGKYLGILVVGHSRHTPDTGPTFRGQAAPRVLRRKKSPLLSPFLGAKTKPIYNGGAGKDYKSHHFWSFFGSCSWTELLDPSFSA